MPLYPRPLLILLFVMLVGTLAQPAMAQDSIRILIIYGSKPAAGHPEQYKWFGGRAGGHVAIEVVDDTVLSFHPTKYPCHLFAKHRPSRFASAFSLQTVYQTWNTFNYNGDQNYPMDSLRHIILTIPLTPAQRAKLNDITVRYHANVPYDYATVGMRCASASYEILAQLGLFDHPIKRCAIWWRILFPRDIRYRLRREIKEGSSGKTWQLQYWPGSSSRIWDWDVKVN